MATSAYMAGLMPLVGSRNHSTGLRSTYLLPCQHAAGAMRIRCQAEDQPQVQPQEQTIPVSPSQQPAQSPPKPKAKESTKFSDVLAFSGPAPERINGRLAMIGFVSALAVELARGDDLATQLMNGGLPWFAGTAALLSVASLVPLFKGVSAQSKSGRLMTADAELWNGRFAMVGLVALAFTEYLKGGPLV
ncbi:early light-induced protein 2, chloroplastic isoform X2 [Elaeis guineensis]|uniref:Early light-induced protein 1, chloroplastic isoform X2 n=1 Tax=Elaeis guineensis var. tenera TaxID=51953 RepID=A0A6I9RAV5_ELAGV|nr:early light-induced protein 1, chloroplastic isoform X2 [Elaeis guineensis]